MGKPPRVILFPDSEGMAGVLLERWAVTATEAIRRKGHFVAALSGGKTPGFFYGAMAAKKNLPWEESHIFLVDERYVPEDDSDSNYGMIKRRLLSAIPIPPGNIHFISTSEPRPEIAARKYEERIRDFFGIPPGSLPEFDIVLLGMGRDGHTASIFPGSPLAEGSRFLSEATFDSAGRPRVTLTLPVINNASNIFFLVIGEDKAEAVRKLVRKKDPAMPAARVGSEKSEVLLLVDRGAAMLLDTGEYERYPPGR